jgi:hypothetical protein
MEIRDRMFAGTQVMFEPVIGFEGDVPGARNGSENVRDDRSAGFQVGRPATDELSTVVSRKSC